jgi:hypothetical protein
MDGFLTLLIMGIGYMIIPRFRSIQLGSVKLASLIFQFIQAVNNDKSLSIWVMVSRISGVIIFLVIVF